MRRLVVRLSSFTVLLSAAVGPAAGAERLCTIDVVTLGDSMTTVRERCGDPVAQRSSCVAAAPVDARSAAPPVEAACVKVDQWNYRSASGRPSTVLRFEAGRLRSLDDDRSTTAPDAR